MRRGGESPPSTDHVMRCLIWQRRHIWREPLNQNKWISSAVHFSSRSLPSIKTCWARDESLWRSKLLRVARGIINHSSIPLIHQNPRLGRIIQLSSPVDSWKSLPVSLTAAIKVFTSNLHTKQILGLFSVPLPFLGSLQISLSFCLAADLQISTLYQKSKSPPSQHHIRDYYER